MQASQNCGRKASALRLTKKFMLEGFSFCSISGFYS